jgi:lipopolysaccharide heptosyltransferase I
MVAADCRLQDDDEEADFIVEARVGTLGTNGHEVVYGIPANNALSTAANLVPNAPAIPTIPELALAKKDAHLGAAKLAVFAYERESRRPVWQSGTSQAKSTAQDIWVLGAGPFQRGSVYDGTQFAGSRIRIPRRNHDGTPAEAPSISYNEQFYFPRAIAPPTNTEIGVVGYEQQLPPVVLGPTRPADSEPVRLPPTDEQQDPTSNSSPITATVPTAPFPDEPVANSLVPPRETVTMCNQHPRILISRLSAIGDCVLTTPLVCAIRDYLPNAHITWVTERASAMLLEGHTAIDELIVVPKGWLKSPAEIQRLRSKLRASRFDIAIDPQGLTKSGAIAWLSGAAQRIGFHKPRGRELNRWFNRELITPTKTHLVDAQLELLKPFGIHNPTVRFDLPVISEVEGKVDAMIQAAHLGCDFIAVNPGAGWDSRLWSTYRYGRVARCLGERHEFPSFVLWSGERERTWAEKIVACSGGRAVLAPPTTLPELASVLRRARMFVGSDTGPLHIATAVGTPCVGLHGTTRPEASGAYGAQHIHIQKRYHDGTSRERRRANNDAMMEIDIDTVVAACEELLARRTAIAPGSAA